MKKTYQIQWLVSGEITWVSRAGKTEKRRCVRAGDRMTVGLVEEDNQYNLIDGTWSVFGVNPKSVKIMKG